MNYYLPIYQFIRDFQISFEMNPDRTNLDNLFKVGQNPVFKCVFGLSIEFCKDFASFPCFPSGAY